jgi:hypothetical protein
MVIRLIFSRFKRNHLVSQENPIVLSSNLIVSISGYGCSQGRTLFIDNGVMRFTGLRKRRIICANWVHAKEEYLFNNLEPTITNPFKRNTAYLRRAFSIGISRQDLFAGLFNGYRVSWALPSDSSFINIRSQSNTDVLVSRSAATNGIYTSDFSKETERTVRKRSSVEADYILYAKLSQSQIDHHHESPIDLNKFAMSSFEAINPLTHGDSEYDRDYLENSLSLDVNVEVRSKRVMVTHLGNILNTEKQIIDCDACLALLKHASEPETAVCSAQYHLVSAGKGLFVINDPVSFIRFSSNWAHFVEDNLPAFHKLISKDFERSVYVQGEIAPAQDELLRTLFPRVKLVPMQAGFSYFFKDVIFNVHRDSRNEAIQGLGSRWPIIDREGMLSIRSLIMSLSPSNPTETRRLFISRRQKGFRKLVNLMELEKRLVNLGFTIVYPELLTLYERVAIFRSAELIIGESGAGMVNCYFAPDQIPIIELRHPGNSKSVEHLGLISVTQQKFVIIEGQMASFVSKLKYGSDAYTVEPFKVIEKLAGLGFK